MICWGTVNTAVETGPEYGNRKVTRFEGEGVTEMSLSTSGDQIRKEE